MNSPYTSASINHKVKSNNSATTTSSMNNTPHDVPMYQDVETKVLEETSTTTTTYPTPNEILIARAQLKSGLFKMNHESILKNEAQLTSKTRTSKGYFIVRPYSWNNILLAAILALISTFLLFLMGSMRSAMVEASTYEDQSGDFMRRQQLQQSYNNKINTFSRHNIYYGDDGNNNHNDGYYERSHSAMAKAKPWYEKVATKTTRNVASGTKGGNPRSRPKPSTKSSPPNRGHLPVDTFMSDGTNRTVSRGRNNPRPKQHHGNKLVCYYGTWAVYRPDAGKYPVENIDPFLCTHIIYGFTGLSYDGLIKPLDPWNDLEDNYGKGAMKRFTNLKKINPELKTIVAIGGWNEGSVKYSNMAMDPEKRSKFVQSVVEFLRKYNFDGLDLDWEYPGSRGGKSYDKQNFVSLLRELKSAFKQDDYLLTAAVSAGKWFIDPAYDIAQVSRYLDLINLMTYDYHGGWETKTGMNAPLFSSPIHDKSNGDKLLNVNFSVNYWIQNGADPQKIMLGVGSYGRSFTLDKAEQNGINAPASQKGQAGPYTREAGSLGYNELCESFQKHPNSWTIVRDPHYRAPYAYNGRQWVGYDDVESLKEKTQFAKSHGLGGMMMWSIETDDFHGRCHNEKYPLLKAIKRELNSNSIEVPTVKPPRKPSTIRPKPTTPRPSTTTTTGIEIEDDDQQRPTDMSTRPPPSRPSSTKKPPSRPTSLKPTKRPTVRPTTNIPAIRPPTSSKPPMDNNNNNQQFTCTSEGMFADPKRCTVFHRCVASAFMTNPFIDYRFDCAPGTAFSEQMQICDFIANVPSCKNMMYNYVY